MRYTSSEPSVLFVNQEDDLDKHPLRGYDVVLADYLAKGHM